jgi:uncharacterized protein YqhQ
MNKSFMILIFGILGFVGGIFIYSILPSILSFFNSFIPNLFSKYFIEALIAGIIGSGLSTIAVLYWANKSSKEEF